MRTESWPVSTDFWRPTDTTTSSCTLPTWKEGLSLLAANESVSSRVSYIVYVHLSEAEQCDDSQTETGRGRGP